VVSIDNWLEEVWKNRSHQASVYQQSQRSDDPLDDSDTPALISLAVGAAGYRLLAPVSRVTLEYFGQSTPPAVPCSLRCMSETKAICNFTERPFRRN